MEREQGRGGPWVGGDCTWSVVQTLGKAAWEWGGKETHDGQEAHQKQPAGTCARIQGLGKKASSQVEEKERRRGEKKGECGNLS